MNTQFLCYSWTYRIQLKIHWNWICGILKLLIHLDEIEIECFFFFSADCNTVALCELQHVKNVMYSIIWVRVVCLSVLK